VPQKERKKHGNPQKLKTTTGKLFPIKTSTALSKAELTEPDGEI